MKKINLVLIIFSLLLIFGCSSDGDKAIDVIFTPDNTFLGLKPGISRLSEYGFDKKVSGLDFYFSPNPDVPKSERGIFNSLVVKIADKMNHEDRIELFEELREYIDKTYEKDIKSEGNGQTYLTSEPFVFISVNKGSWSFEIHYDYYAHFYSNLKNVSKSIKSIGTKTFDFRDYNEVPEDEFWVIKKEIVLDEIWKNPESSIFGGYGAKSFEEFIGVLEKINITSAGYDLIFKKYNSEELVTFQTKNIEDFCDTCQSEDKIYKLFHENNGKIYDYWKIHKEQLEGEDYCECPTGTKDYHTYFYNFMINGRCCDLDIGSVLPSDLPFCINHPDFNKGREVKVVVEIFKVGDIENWNKAMEIGKQFIFIKDDFQGYSNDIRRGLGL